MLGAALVVGALLVLGTYAYFSRDLPSVSALRDYRPPQTTRVYDRNKKVIGEIFSERRTVIPMSKVPRHMVLSVLAAEDADFYEHEGLDYTGILRAVFGTLFRSHSGSGGRWLTGGGTRSCRMASATIPVASPPAAPIRGPGIDWVDA